MEKTEEIKKAFDFCSTTITDEQIKDEINASLFILTKGFNTYYDYTQGFKDGFSAGFMKAISYIYSKINHP